MDPRSQRVDWGGFNEGDAGDDFLRAVRRCRRDRSWFYNIRFTQESGEMLTSQRWLAEGIARPLAGSITSDFLIGTIPVLIWMFVEGRRLGMRHLWAYAAVTFLVAFAFGCPLFLLMRERHLQRLSQGAP